MSCKKEKNPAKPLVLSCRRVLLGWQVCTTLLPDSQGFTEFWLDPTLSDPLRHSAVVWDIVWQASHGHHTDQLNTKRQLDFKLLNTAINQLLTPDPQV